MNSTPRFRRFFYGQRLNSVGIPFLFGILLFASFSPWLSAGVTFLTALFLLLFFFLQRDREARAALICAVIGLSLALISAGIQIGKENRLQAFYGTELTVSGYVTASREDGYDLRVKSPFRGKVRILSDEAVPIGEAGSLLISVHNGISAEAEREGVDLSATARGEWEKTGTHLGYAAVGYVRARVIEAFGDGREGGFLRTILLGDREALSSRDQAEFRKTSSSHLLAISGLHVARLLGVFGSVVQWIPVKRRMRNLFMVPILFFLLLVTGSSVSVFRAVVMAAFPLIGDIFNRRSDDVTSLVFAACLLAAWEPNSVLSPSFLLSFSATFGILTVASPLGESFYYSISEDHLVQGKWRGPYTAMIQGVISSSVTFVFTLPFQLLLFGTVSPLAPLYAIFLIPLFSPCLILGFSSAFGGVLGIFADASRWVSVKGCGLFLELHSFVASSAAAPLDLGIYAPIPAFLILGCLLFMMILRKKLVFVLYLHVALLAVALIAFPFL